MLKSYHIFITLAETQSYSKCAQSLNISNSSVSRAIQQLEFEYGVTLIKRSTRHVSLTEYGQQFYLKVKAMLEDMNSLKLKFHKDNELYRGIVKLSAPWYFSASYIAPLLKAFNQQYPHIHIEINCEDKLEDISNSPTDIFIRAGRLNDSELYYKRLFSYGYSLVTTNCYLKRNTTPILCPNNLKQHTLLALKLNSAYNSWLFTKNDHDYRIDPFSQALLISNSSEVITNAVLSGAGIALLPDIFVKPYLQSQKLITLLPDYKSTANHFDNAIYLLYSKEKSHLLKNKAVIHFISEHVQRLTD